MKAVTWQGFRDIQVEEVVDPGDQGAERREHQGHQYQHLRIPDILPF
jgi:hypothetical protein